MKQFYLTLLGAMFMTSAYAYTGEGGLVLDSTYTTDVDGVRLSKDVYEYNSAKQETAVYTYDYFSLDGSPRLSGKDLITYDAQGRRVKDEEYDINGEEATLSQVTEYTDFDALGRAQLYIVKAIDEENPSAGLQEAERYIIKSFYGDTESFVDAEITTTSGGMTMSGTIHCDYASNGTLSKYSMTVSFMGYAIESVTTFEYDSHYQVTKEVSITPYAKIVSTYENAYYDDGNLKRVKSTDTTDAGTSVTISYYFWGQGNSAGLTPATLSRQIQRCFDLNGRSYQGIPDGKGLYILNGKKIFRK